MALRTSIIVALAVLATPLLSEARPYRAMVTRTAATTPNGRLEIGLRYQGFFQGAGRNVATIGFVGALPYQQLAATVRWGIVRNVEMNLEFQALTIHNFGASNFSFYFGDVPIGVQWTFVDKQKFGAGIYVRGTVPTGPSNIDAMPPTLSDGTFDLEGTFFAELRPTRQFRLMVNLGFLYHGVRPDSRTIPQFDVPEALRFDLAATLNVGPQFLLALEFVGRQFLERRITPVWDDNAQQFEIIPGARFEATPGLVFEAAAGVAVSRDLLDMYRFRLLLGFTYEFDT